MFKSGLDGKKFSSQVLLLKDIILENNDFYENENDITKILYEKLKIDFNPKKETNTELTLNEFISRKI